MVLDFSRNLILTKLCESTKCKALIFFFIILLLQGGLRVCNDAILLDLGVVLREFLFKLWVLQFYKTKQFAVFGNFEGILMQFAVVYSVWCLNIQVMYFCSVLQYSYTPYTVRLPPSLWHFIKGALIK